MISEILKTDIKMYDDLSMLVNNSDNIAMYINEGSHNRSPINSDLYTFVFSITTYCDKDNFDKTKEKLTQLFLNTAQTNFEIKNIKGRIDIGSPVYMDGFTNKNQFQFFQQGTVTYSVNVFNTQTLSIDGLDIEEISPEDSLESSIITDENNGLVYVKGKFFRIKTSFYLNSGNKKFVFDALYGKENKKYLVSRLNGETRYNYYMRVVNIQSLHDKNSGLTVINLTMQEGE